MSFELGVEVVSGDSVCFCFWSNSSVADAVDGGGVCEGDVRASFFGFSVVEFVGDVEVFAASPVVVGGGDGDGVRVGSHVGIASYTVYTCGSVINIVVLTYSRFIS